MVNTINYHHTHHVKTPSYSVNVLTSMDNSLIDSTSSCINNNSNSNNCKVKEQFKSQKTKTAANYCSINFSTFVTIVVFIITSTLATPILGGPFDINCDADPECPDYPRTFCINGTCRKPMDRMSSCSRDVECKANLNCIHFICDCESGLKWSYIKDSCVQCEVTSDCHGQVCHENQCIEKPPEGYSYLPLAFAFAILVSIVLIFSFKIITTSSGHRLSSSRQQLFNEDGSSGGSGSNRRRRSSRRFQRQYSSDLPDYAPPPPYSVAIASSPVIFTPPVVSTISSIVSSNEPESPVTSRVPLTSTTSVLTTVTPASKPTEV